MDAAAAEAGLRDDERLPLAAEQRLFGNPDVLVVDEGVRALVDALAVEADVAHDVDAGRVRRHQEHRHPLVGADVGVRDGHHDQERRRLGVGREELPAVDDPLVPVLLGPGGEQRRVRAGVRLGHGVAREALAVEQRLQVALLLLGRAVVGDDLRVARVGRLAAEDDGRPGGSAEDLVEQRELQLAVALPAELGPEVRGPEPLAPHLLLQRVDGLTALALQRDELEVGEREVERLDLLPDELVDPVQFLLVVGIGLEVPRHAAPSLGRFRRTVDARI